MPRLALALALLALLAGQRVLAAASGDDAAAAPVNVTAGFLADYDRLDKGGMPRKRYLAYTAPGAEGRAIHAVQVLPSVVAPPDAVFDDVAPELLTALTARLDSRLRAALSEHARLSDDPDGADVQLAAAVTAVGAQEKGRRLLDLVPVRLVTGSVRNAVQGKELEAVVTFELRVLDAATGQVLRERIDHVTGDEIGRSGDPETRLTQEALAAAADEWVKRVVKSTVPELD